MAVIQASPSVPITTANNGDYLIIGSPSEVESGMAAIQFVDNAQLGKSPGFNGGLQVLGMSRVNDALRLGTPLVPNKLLLPWPYRAMNLIGNNGSPVFKQDGSMISDGTVITGSSAILVPNSGFWIVLLVTCTAGGGTVYATNVVGACSP